MAAVAAVKGSGSSASCSRCWVPRGSTLNWAVRLWSLHPCYLDAQGLVALWREALLAQAVLRGRTKGYRHHPQLERFRAQRSPRAAINAYLAAIYAEAMQRGYAFDRRKFGRVRPVGLIGVSSGQVAYEWRHLMKKLARRDRMLHRRWSGTARPQCHPLFRRRRGPVESWER